MLDEGPRAFEVEAAGESKSTTLERSQRRQRASTTTAMQPPSTTAAFKRTAGIVLVLIVVGLWVGSSFFIKFIFGELNFNKSFFLTYTSTSLFVVYLIGHVAWRAVAKAVASGRSGGQGEAREGELDALMNDDGGDRGFASAGVGDEGSGLAAATTATRAAAAAAAAATRTTTTLWDPEYNYRYTAKLALAFSPIWFAANYTFNLSLGLTSVSSNTIISNSSPFFAREFWWGSLPGAHSHSHPLIPPSRAWLGNPWGQGIVSQAGGGWCIACGDSGDHLGG